MKISSHETVWITQERGIHLQWVPLYEKNGRMISVLSEPELKLPLLCDSEQEALEIAKEYVDRPQVLS